MSTNDELPQANAEYTKSFDLTFTNRELQDKVRQDLDADASDLDFLPFSDREESVRENVAFLLSSPLIPGDVNVRGCIYDVRDGKLSEVSFEPAEAHTQT